MIGGALFSTGVSIDQFRESNGLDPIFSPIIFKLFGVSSGEYKIIREIQKERYNINKNKTMIEAYRELKINIEELTKLGSIDKELSNEMIQNLNEDISQIEQNNKNISDSIILKEINKRPKS